MNELSSIIWVTFVGYLIAVFGGGPLPDIGSRFQVSQVVSYVVDSEQKVLNADADANLETEIVKASDVNSTLLAETGVVHYQENQEN